MRDFFKSHWAVFGRKMAVATIVAGTLGFIGGVVAPALYFLVYVALYVDPEELRGSDLAYAYHDALTKAVILKEDQRLGLFVPAPADGRGSFLCHHALVDEARILAARPDYIRCNVTHTYWDKRKCDGAARDVCAVVELDPEVYGDPELHGQIAEALWRPCDFLSPEIAAQKGVYEFGKRSQLEERKALACDSGGLAHRKVVILVDKHVDILEFNAGPKSP